MSKYITLFNETGPCTVYVRLICKNWTKNCYISKTGSDKFIFVKVRAWDGCRCEISQEQASEIIEKLGLIFVQNSSFKNAGTYYDVKTAQTELNRLTQLYNDKVSELKVLDDVIQTYITAL